MRFKATLHDRPIVSGEIDEGDAALRRYGATRQQRTARIQLTSRQNAWGNGATDADRIYGYNAYRPAGPGRAPRRGHGQVETGMVASR